MAILHSFVVLTSLISFIVAMVGQGEVPIGYEWLVFMPLSFAVIYGFIIIPSLKTNRLRITVYMYLIRTWVRMTLLPMVMVLSGNYFGIHYALPTSSSISTAISLIIYEVVVSSLLLLFLTSFYSKRVPPVTTNIRADGNKVVYFFFIILAIAVYLTVGRPNNLIQFFMISAEGARYGDETNTLLVLAKRIITVGLGFAFIWIAYYCKKRYELTSKKIYVNIALISALINVMVIVGERRSAIIYSAFVTGYILVKMFPKHRRKILRQISIAGGTVLLLMSIYKFFGAFLYDSYITSIQSASISLAWLSHILQIYFGSPQNVALAVDMKETLNLPFSNLLFDFGRSTFGLSFFLKDQGTLTSVTYNTFIYGRFTEVGHVIPSIGYGYVYLGFILSPVIVSINIYLSSKFETWFYEARSYETIFIWGFILIRLASVYASTPPLISGASITIFTHGLLYFVAAIMNGKYLGRHKQQVQRISQLT